MEAEKQEIETLKRLEQKREANLATKHESSIQKGQATLQAIRDQKAAPRGQVCPLRGAVTAEHAHVAQCSFAHLGGAGVQIKAGAVEHSDFRDLSGGAVMLGSTDPEHPTSGQVLAAARSAWGTR